MEIPLNYSGVIFVGILTNIESFATEGENDEFSASWTGFL